MATVTPVVDLVTGTVQVTIDADIAHDLFTRTEAVGWAASTSGHNWTTFGGAGSDFSVNGTRGLHHLGVVNSSRRTYFSSEPFVTGVSDFDAYFNVQVPATATGAAIQAGFIGRHSDTSNFYMWRVDFNTDSTVSVHIQEFVAGGNQILVSSTATNLTYTANVPVNVRAQAAGDLLQMKVWANGTVEPTQWLLSIRDTSLVTGSAGFRSQLNSGNTNTLPVLVSYDALEITVADPAYLWRVYPDGTRQAVLGSPVGLSDDQAVMYDSLAPLNTEFHYALTGADPGVTSYLSVSVFIGVGHDGWVRDYAEPPRDVRLDNCTTHSPACLSGGNQVFFQRLDGEGYANSSGIFPLVGSQYPRVVSEVREALTATLTVVSRRLTEVPALRDLFSSGRVLMLELPMDYGWGTTTWGQDWVAVGDVGVSRIATDMRKPYRVWTAPLTVTDTPADPFAGLTAGNGVGVTGARWQDLADSGLTWQGLVDTGNTWLDTAQGDNY